MAALGTHTPPDPEYAVIRVDALEAALANLNITGITAAQLLDAVKKEEKTLPPPPFGHEQTNALPTPAKSSPSGSMFPYKSTFSMEPVNDRSDADKERRARLHDIAMKAFPDGKIPDPYTVA